ncbi:hypothetical protein B0H14DRAFT_2369275 [Mycena olivaceomarginata]|nr:hypothetical protein B0H14DRAFT_2369275 [Mycena olivaceomarginata]
MPPPPHNVPVSHSTSPANKADGVPTPTPISEKHAVVLSLFKTQVELPTWSMAVQAWHALEAATGFLITGKVLLTRGRPPAVQWWIARARKASQIPAGIDGNDDEREDFYANVISWWLALNPGWRKEGIATEGDWVAHGLKWGDGGDLGDLPAGLNGLTSMMACLWWWYRIAGITRGSPEWKKLLADVQWVLMEKTRVVSGKCTETVHLIYD